MRGAHSSVTKINKKSNSSRLNGRMEWPREGEKNKEKERKGGEASHS